MFIGRERELQALERLFYSDHFEFAVIYGRRRVGKTALISRLFRIKMRFILWVLKAVKNKILKT